ncbi:MAG: hypothetical protein NPIRA05_04340 [Nitrospirales bacterium]|nr:MAG: hypothetical protein NPIRA05_04340 [Nitrospirales bacterium]
MREQRLEKVAFLFSIYLNRKSAMSTINLFILLLFGTWISLVSLYISTMPYVYISVAWCVVLLYAWKKLQRTIIKTLCISIAGVLLIFAVVELYLGLKDEFWRTQYAQRKQITKPTKLIPDPILGYVNNKNVKVSESLHYGDKLEWRAEYTIDSNGLRVSSRFENSSESTECVVFFGGSFTFGKGVRDEQTLPYQVDLKTDGKYQIYNFGVGGYGPHQMLAALEFKLDEKILRCKPKYAIYQGFTVGKDGHDARAAGKVPWDTHGPRYVLENETKVRFAGHFDDVSGDLLRLDSVVEKFKNQINKSFIVEKLLLFLHGSRIFISYDSKLYLAIVHRAKTIFEQRYPDSEFHVIYWDPSRDTYNSVLADIIIDGFNERKIPVHLTSDMFPRDLHGSDQMHVSEHDGHPSALAHSLIAEYVVNNILKE